MPNHIQNRIEFLGTDEQVRGIKEFIAGKPCNDEKEIVFDFNKLIPMPQELKIESGSWGSMGQYILFGKGEDSFLGINELWRRFSSKSREDQRKIVELGFKYQDNLENHGHATWYGWCKENWGTKWNAYSSYYESDNVLMFQTAWNGVPGIIKLLSQNFPNVEFLYEWSDEDTGQNCSIYRYINGDVIEYEELENGSIEAFELAFRLRPERREWYKIVDGEYQYDEERDLM